MFLMKIAFDPFGLFLTTAKKAANILHHLALIGRSLTSYRIGFYIVVEHLIRVEFRTVSGKEK